MVEVFINGFKVMIPTRDFWDFRSDNSEASAFSRVGLSVAAKVHINYFSNCFPTAIIGTIYFSLIEVIEDGAIEGFKVLLGVFFIPTVFVLDNVLVKEAKNI